ncbi:striated muscle-specific serine/threonine-protein kinase-like [Eulemur rufifrons]|uniref:striated muscle-specific serine/threonine-protein kinase-like n=1 Tax=Eulemur rufifrons TaxID=859984 RepID=UPI0037432E5F
MAQELPAGRLPRGHCARVPSLFLCVTITAATVPSTPLSLGSKGRQEQGARGRPVRSGWRIPQVTPRPRPLSPRHPAPNLPARARSPSRCTHLPGRGGAPAPARSLHQSHRLRERRGVREARSGLGSRRCDRQGEGDDEEEEPKISHRGGAPGRAAGPPRTQRAARAPPRGRLAPRPGTALSRAQGPGVALCPVALGDRRDYQACFLAFYRETDARAPDPTAQFQRHSPEVPAPGLDTCVTSEPRTNGGKDRVSTVPALAAGHPSRPGPAALGHTWVGPGSSQPWSGVVFSHVEATAYWSRPRGLHPRRVTASRTVKV